MAERGREVHPGGLVWQRRSDAHRPRRPRVPQRTAPGALWRHTLLAHTFCELGPGEGSPRFIIGALSSPHSVHNHTLTHSHTLCPHLSQVLQEAFVAALACTHVHPAAVDRLLSHPLTRPPPQHTISRPHTFHPHLPQELQEAVVAALAYANSPRCYRQGACSPLSPQHMPTQSYDSSASLRCPPGP